MDLISTSHSKARSKYRGSKKKRDRMTDGQCLEMQGETTSEWMRVGDWFLSMNDAVLNTNVSHAETQMTPCDNPGKQSRHFHRLLR